MTDQQLRGIFARFHNLRLAWLIAGLEAGQVCRSAWVDESGLGQAAMCPLWHGMPRYESRDDGERGEQAEVFYGFSLEPFVDAWDVVNITDDRLLAVLRSIWAERVADAEAWELVVRGEVATC